LKNLDNWQIIALKNLENHLKNGQKNLKKLETCEKIFDRHPDQVKLEQL